MKKNIQLDYPSLKTLLLIVEGRINSTFRQKTNVNVSYKIDDNLKPSDELIWNCTIEGSDDVTLQYIEDETKKLSQCNHAGLIAQLDSHCTIDVIAQAFSSIRLHGTFNPANCGEQSTYNDVLTRIHNLTAYQYQDYVNAENTCQWLGQTEQDDVFIKELSEIVSFDRVLVSKIATLVNAANLYSSHINDYDEAHAYYVKNGKFLGGVRLWVGEEDKPVKEHSITHVKTYSHEMRNRTIYSHEFRDSAGRLFLWDTSKELGIKQNATVPASFIVKRHSIVGIQAINQITRVSFGGRSRSN